MVEEDGPNEVLKPIEESQIVEDKSGKIGSEEIIERRKKKIVGFFKTRYSWISYIVLALIVWMAVRIRTLNLPGLKDVTTGTWTLGPDLDPFLFLRYAKEIVASGSLFAATNGIDMMRYVPLGFDTSIGFKLQYYLIAWFHNYLGPLFGTESVTHSAVIFPAFMFGLTVIAFFFLTRKIFIDSMGVKNASIIALLASFFLSVLPSLLPRTIAGIPEKESAAFLFMFLAFYFFLSSWKTKKNLLRYIFAILAGVATAAMALIWGGYAFIFVALVPAVFISFLLGKTDRNRIYSYVLWIASAFIIMSYFSARYTLKNLFVSVTTGSSIVVLLVILVHFVIYNTKIKEYFQRGKLSKIPPKINSLIVTVLLLVILSSLFFGVSFVPNQVQGLYDSLVKPATSRLIQTVAENRQPYFTEWAFSFGPVYRGIPLMFWLFFIGSIYLFAHMVKVLNKRERISLTLAYSLFLVATIFSRYSSSSSFNGENFLSLAFYGLGFIVFVATFGNYYYKRYKSGELSELKKIDFGFIFLLSFFFLGIISARAAVRVIMVLVPPVSIIVSYFVVALFSKAKKTKKGSRKLAVWIVLGIVIIATFFTGFGFYNSSSGQAKGYVPSAYTQQWQKAMFWVRENVREDAVFGHWWDYGYWVQSIGERATVLDGGNVISYWNHLMGRHALTGTQDEDALDFLYAHGTTHFLIDSTDIGKYSAFSTIGSDVNYDRASFMSTFSKDPNQIQERKNSVVFFYNAGISLDADIIYEGEDGRIFLPRGQAGLGAILVEKSASNNEIIGVEGIFVYQGNQYTLPLRYAFEKEFIDFGSGVESGVFIFPKLSQSGGGFQVDEEGSLLYLSQRTVKSQLARHYLYNEENPYFELVHSEDDLFVAQIKNSNPDLDFDFVYFQGIRGPIKIWEINYPSNMELNEEYLSKKYPEELRIGR